MVDLPWELIEEILSRVPATSLRRLQHTCKRWNVLFRDPKFIKEQLNKASKQYTVLVLSGLKIYSMSVNLHGIHNKRLLSLKDFHNSKKVKIYRIFQCDGLLLCTTSPDLRLVVWNPCTGQTRRIQYGKRYKSGSMFSLGYEENKKSCGKSYKILRYANKYDDVNLYYQVVEYEIYDFSSGSWRDRSDFTPKNYSTSFSSDGVSLKGNTYWIAMDEKNEEELLLSFDFSTEKFRIRCLPRCLPQFPDFDTSARALSVIKEECLAVLYNRMDPLKIEIWMTTDDKIDQWSKFLSVDIHDNSILHNRLFSHKTAFFIDEEKKMAVLCDMETKFNNISDISDISDMVYIVGEDNVYIKISIREYRYKISRPLVLNYVPSLVQMSRVDKNTKTQKETTTLISHQH